MDEDRIGGMADKAVGTVKSAAGDVTGDAKLQAEGTKDKVVGTVRNTVGGARDAASDAAEAVSEKVSDLGQRASRAMEGGAGPLLDQVGRKASEYGSHARDVVASGAESASSVVRGYPLVTVGLVGVLCFLIGRVTAPEPKPWYRRDWT
ncbi:CsbD family protein [Pararoseomonas sp. SCSIO 73927]|uniref:CsbD family protein n=1 Tax=Pararoseomonas sp. SCSIO 73927 TaxID=3114537 RepID=UPI0030D2EE10